MRFSSRHLGASRKAAANELATVARTTDVISAQSTRERPAESAPVTPAEPPDELIRLRAYELWERRGCPMGQDGEQDWYAARDELKRERLGWTTPEQADRNKI